MSNVLVTGAGGYIGAILTRQLLDAGHQVVAVDRFFFGRDTLPPEGGRLRIVRADSRRLPSSLFQQMDAVIDLAALSNDPSGELDTRKTWEINHAARIRTAQLARQAGVARYLFPSSCSVYGSQDGILDETSPTKPLTTYAQANDRAEQDIRLLGDDAFCVVVLRQATTYGFSPRMRFDLAINGMVRGIVTHGNIPVLRDGTQWRPFIHVRDTARAMLLMLEVPRERINGQIFNVGSDDQNVQIMELAKTVAEAIGRPFAFEWYGLPDRRSYRVSFRRIREWLGFETTCTPADGAREVYEALLQRRLDPDDPKTITVQWYKHLLEMHAFLKDIELDGEVL
jgi:nucleoside-diphosphate-sugar epimerase